MIVPALDDIEASIRAAHAFASALRVKLRDLDGSPVLRTWARHRPSFVLNIVAIVQIQCRCVLTRMSAVLRSINKKCNIGAVRDEKKVLWI